MPEITVENEPWLGLVVLANKRRKKDKPGYFGLARAEEWHSENPYVTLWRGPNYPDETVSRKVLVEMNCRTVLVDEQGYYVCPPIEEELYERVEKKSEVIFNELANERAAETMSYIGQEDFSEKYGNEYWVRATVGDAVAVNGDLDSLGKRKPPRGYVTTEDGGLWPGGMEEEIDLDHVALLISFDLSKELYRTVDQETVRRILRLIYRRDNYIRWGSDSGNIEVWASPKAIKAWEEEGEESARERTVRQRKAAEEHRKMEEERRRREFRERRERVKRGGYPGPKDWSPSGRAPGEESGLPEWTG